jgi:hypothetical protein
MVHLMTWLDPTLIRGDFLCFCTTEAEFVKELKRTNVPTPWPKWIDDDALAMTHYVVTAKGNRVSFVCLADKKLDGISIMGLLVHEAVHVVQEYFRYIGEESPSVEFQAYAIQKVSTLLAHAYLDKQVKKRK